MYLVFRAKIDQTNAHVPVSNGKSTKRYNILTDIQLVRCSLFVVRCSLFAVRCSLFVVSKRLYFYTNDIMTCFVISNMYLY